MFEFVTRGTRSHCDLCSSFCSRGWAWLSLPVCAAHQLTGLLPLFLTVSCFFGVMVSQWGRLGLNRSSQTSVWLAFTVFSLSLCGCPASPCAAVSPPPLPSVCKPGNPSYTWLPISHLRPFPILSKFASHPSRVDTLLAIWPASQPSVGVLAICKPWYWVSPSWHSV